MRAHCEYGSFEHPFGLKVADRLRAILTTLEDGWRRSRAGWQAVLDRIAAAGDVGQLATTLRTAAALAARDGDRDALAALLVAVPAGTHVTVLPALFQDELAAHRPPPHATAMARDALRRVRQLLAADASDTPVPPAAPVQPGHAAMVRAGDGWNVTFAGRTVQVRHLKGLDDLAVLFARPEHDFHCLELIGGGDLGGDALPGLDERARREYRTRMRELQEDADAARDANDPVRAERAEAELDALVQQLSASFGLSGRARATGSAVERARSAVTWRVRAALKRLGEVHPDLGKHVRNAVRTGTWCAYRPETAVAWRIETA